MTQFFRAAPKDDGFPSRFLPSPAGLHPAVGGGPLIKELTDG